MYIYFMEEKAMHNPFRYGVPVSGEYYLARPKLVKKLLKYTLSGQKLLLYGPRRFGKTSFLQEYVRTLSKQKISAVVVDTYPITSHRDFLHALTRGLRGKGVKSLTESIKTLVESIFRIRPRISLEEDGIALDFAIPSLSDQEVKMAIEDTIKAIARLYKKHSLIVIIDEFQKVVEIGDKGWLEGTLRSEIQKQAEVPYIFCGSRRSLILDMFQNSSKPFYHLATPIELPKFGQEFVDWLIKRLKGVNIKISNDVAQYMLDVVGWSPNYAQMIAFHLVADQPTGSISPADINLVLDNLCQLNGYTYMTLFDSLPSNAQRVVRMSAINPGQSPFKQSLMRQYELSSSAVQAAIRSLINKRVLDDATSKGKLLFDDPLFLRWVQKSFSY